MASIPLLLLTGCQKEETNTSDGQKFTIMATAASTADTKTTLGEDLFVSWQQGDAIDIACSNTGTTLFEFTADAAGKTVPFTCDEGKLAEFTAGDKAKYTYYGMYPAFNTYEWDGDEFRTMIPKNQAVTDDCPTLWDPKAAIAAGTCKGERLIMPFKNAHALVKVVLPQWNIEGFDPISVMLMGRGADDILAGDYWVTPSETGLPTLRLIDNPNHVRTVALTKPSYSPKEAVFLVVPPGTAHGLSVFVSSTTRTARISTTQNITFEQNKIYVLDFSGTEIKNLGEPVEAHPHVPNIGDYIVVSTDGSVAYYQVTNDQSGQPDRWNSEIFELINGVYTPYQITTEKIIFIEKTGGPNYSYAVALMTSNSNPIGWLMYDMEWQGSRLIRDNSFNPHNVRPNQIPAEATIYTIYHQ
ncbi:MAG: hypothetical protein IJL58_10780 [Bacteroidales bacterium]|nr:hypothetical protein [Bacteroidales bacterium]